MLVLVDLEHGRDDPLEEGPVVAHDDDAGVEPGDEGLEPGQPVEVQVVGRLVEQVHVEAAQHGGHQLGPRRLPAGQHRHGPVEDGVEAELPPRGRHAGVEVGGAERQPPFEGGGVPIVGTGVGRGDRLGGVVELDRGRLDAGATPQEAAHRFAGPPLGLLREVADVGVGRRRGHPAPLGVLHPGEDAEERRLAHAVRADHSDAVAGRDREIDVGEDRTAAVRDGDAARHEGGGAGHGLNVSPWSIRSRGVCVTGADD